MSTENLRRSSRLKVRKPKRYMSSNSDENLDDNPVNTVEDELRDVEENVQKPVELFSSDDVSGQALYKFQTPSRKDAMTKKAHLCRTPINDVLLPIAKVVLEKINVYNKEQPKTSKKDQKISKIPVIQRKYEFGLTSSESESISESSDYHPVEDTEETTDSEDVVSSNDEKDQMKIRNQKQKFISQSHLLNTPKRVTRKNKPSIIHKDFHMQTDEYFATQSEKVVTSDRTLEHLRNSRLTKEKLEKLLTNQSHVSLQHKKNIYSVTNNYSTLFPMWYFIMEQGYTVLLYGLGSKRCLINDFYKSISYHPSLVVNGFFPSLTMKDILDGIIIDLLELNCPSNTTECIDLIEKTLRKNPKDRLYLLIHNIDGMMLRSNKAQDLLSCLANIPNICVLASVDHINAPLLWDHTKHSKFKFFWWDTTTFLSYQEETSYESSLLVKQSGALALSSLHNVFLSLTSNAKSIYLLLVKNQLSNSNNVNFTGMAFKDLYRAAREGFLVSSDLALRAQLTEFIDHKLVKIKRNIDSIEHLIIPLSSGLLKQFLEEHDT
ncbi:origin recognition complex subunit 2 isoform X1 [Bombus huntii]|uniref:origin recognition complex subunit 2 isoform X1 n=1 Tax=Bombus huntii TaxID=85661 RepID=UPI0021A9E9B7|nr:origin recognition complex subunit 2 isoform X1 [Bombus huntii]XP_050483081.1 origin recognition complex subunit 2 isoform X1 [Bombus huntii]XP_050483082.1 origin recognition complex subunit 2 isoform X1 [Bombus huntii]XP_050483083.1 origin recognition complex subunit 2 isoform X1 [Bombus huntii]XP_050483084.1 origin recognition complex subunit 2 isoform X1 [Bombus huntii]XP_050483086.1 origin recognition complex subunit 2 isoform X1 [Bombus huntii]